MRDLFATVVAVVARETGVAAELLTGLDRQRSPAGRARYLVIYLVHVAGGVSQARVAALVGCTRRRVGQIASAIEDRRDCPRFDAWMDGLEEAVAAGSAACEQDAWRAAA